MTMVEKIARALEDAEIGYSLRLTRLVDGVSEYTLTYDDGQTHIFEEIDDAHENIRLTRRKAQARAVLSTLETPTPEMVEAAVEGTGPVGCCCIQDRDAQEIWSAMIRKAMEG